MGRTLPTVTHDDVNAAFADRSYLKENDDRILAYLDVLCSTVYPERCRPPPSE